MLGFKCNAYRVYLTMFDNNRSFLYGYVAKYANPT